MLNSTLLGLCNSFASIIQQVLNLVTPFLSAVGLGSLVPSVSSICTSLFGTA